MKTKREMRDVKFGPGHSVATVPAGTRAAYHHGQLFVDDFSFLPAGSMRHHDAYYYGIRLQPEDVE